MIKTNTGKALENRIMMAARVYEHSNQLIIDKVDPPVAIVKVKGAHRVKFLANPYLDFIGSVKYGKLAFPIQIEAKSYDKPSLPVGGETGVRMGQLESMRRWESQGWTTCVIWEHKLQWAFISLAEIERVILKRKSLPWGTGELIISNRVVVDYLPNLKRLIGDKNNELKRCS
jgi:penicillin-binding protein-related factor A (putative recombinase)